MCGGERIPVQDRVEDDRGGLAREGQRTRRHLVKDRPEREEVRARVRELTARLLGGHVRHGAHRRSGRREVVLRADGLEERDGAVGSPARHLDSGEAEVEDLRLAAGVHEDVRRFDVPVHDAPGMRRLEGVGDLDAHGEQVLQVERRTPRHHLRERLAFEELHDDEVLPLVLLDRVNRADSRMVQRGGGTRLALETLERRRVLGQLGGQELQRDAAAEARVLRLVHDAHSTASEPADDRVMGDALPDQGIRRTGHLRQRLHQVAERQISSNRAGASRLTICPAFKAEGRGAPSRSRSSPRLPPAVPAARRRTATARARSRRDP